MAVQHSTALQRANPVHPANPVSQAISVHTTSRHEHGSVTMIMAAGLVFFALLLGGVAKLGAVASDQARARTAADAAALAGAAEGCAKAAEFAVANEATLMRCEVTGAEVTVDVRVAEATARARARKEAVP